MVVYCRLQANPRNKVAVKCVEKDKLSKAAVENLLVEIGMLKKLRHPHVVQMKDFRWDDQYVSKPYTNFLRDRANPCIMDLKMVCSLSAHFVTFSIPYLFQIVQLNFG